MTIQPQNNNLNYLIDPTFTNVNRLFVLSFARTNAGDNRDSFSDYYVPNVGYFKENYKVIAIDLSKQTKLKDPQQINVIGKLDEANEATMFFIIEKSKETAFNTIV